MLGRAQGADPGSAPADSARLGTPARPVAAASAVDEEIVLENIDIQGRVEKPNVIVVPKRIAPDIADVEPERSFQPELKNGVEGIPSPERAIGKIEPVPSIKKTIKKTVEKNRN
jgi:hypothetical protein